MATVQELERAFLNAHNAGDAQAAQALADALRQAMATQPAPQPAAAPKERTMLEAAKDIGAGAVSGVGALAQLPGQLYGLATGDFSDTGLTKIGRELRETGEGMKSEALKQREAERAAKIAEASKEGQVSAGVAAFMETIKDPALLSNFIAEQAPNLIPGFAVARGLSAAGMTVGAVRGAIGTGAVQQGADIGAGSYEQLYKELVKQGVPEEEAAGRALGYARATGAAATVISALAQRLPGGRAIEEAMAKVPGKGSRLMGAVKGGAGETVSEMIEEGGGKVAQNLAMQQVDPTKSLTEGLGETMGMAAVGGLGLGTAAGLSRRPLVETLPREEKPAEVGATAVTEQPTAPVPTGPSAEEMQRRADEEAIRARAEAPPVPEAEFVSGEPAPEPPEVAAQKEQMAEDEKALVAERNKLMRGEKGKSLWSAIQGNLTQSDLAELGDKSFAGLRAPRGMPGKSISELAADGSLNPWLPPELQIIKGQETDLARMEGDVLTRAKEADEYIKDQLRQRNYLTYATNQRLTEIGTSLADIESSYREFADEELANRLFQEAFDEQRAIDQETAGVAPEGEVGGLEPPARVFETIPEEPVEEEYFPDQEELRGGLAEKDVRTPEFRKWFGDSKVTGKDGNPLRMYHSTASDFEAFDTTRRSIGGEGSWFSSKPSSSEYVEEGTNIIPVYLSLQNPKIIDVMRESDDVLKKKFIEQGYDGAVMMRDGEIVTAVAFYPNQIKSVFNERPTEKPGILEEREKFVINKDPEHERIEKELTGKSMLQVAQWAVDNAPNQFAKAIAQKVSNRLNGMAKRGIKMEFDVASGQQRPVKMYNARGLVEFDFGRPGEGKQPAFKMTINGAAVMDNQGGYPPGARYITVLHELLHVATVGQINVLKGSDPLVQDLRDLFNKVVTHFNTEVRAGRLTPIMEKMYAQEINALSSPDELLAWGIADKEMQEFLSEIKVGDQTIMDKLVELIRKILNVTKPYLTALDQLVKTTESILDEDVDVVGDKIIAKQYSFGVKPGMGEAVQGSLFEQAGKPSRIERAKQAAKAAIQPRKLPKSQFEGVSDEYYDALKPVFAPEKKTIIDKIDGMRNDFWQKLAQGIADQYRSIKDIDEEAYMKARMSKTVDGALEGLLFNGEVKLTDGALDIAKDTKGLLKALEPVGNEVDRYQIWVALNRDAQLVRQGKAPSVNAKLVEKRNELSKGMIGNKSRLEVYRQVQKDMNNLNRSVLKIALDQGLIDRKAFNIFSRDINYIPFYKVIDEDGDVQSAATNSGLINQYFSKALEGGEKPFGDLMENTLRNWSHILSASMKNEAANATVNAAMRLNEAFPNLKSGLSWVDGKVYATKRMATIDRINDDDKLTDAQKKKKIDGVMKPYVDAIMEREDISDQKKDSLIEGLYAGLAGGDGVLRGEYTTSDRKGLIKVMRDGQPTYFDIKDKLLLESIMSIGYMGPKSKFTMVARDFKNMLQFGVTISPAFKIRNLIRDSVSALAVTDLKRNPFANVLDGWAASDRNNPAHISALAGGAIFNFGSYYEGDQAKLIKRLLDKGVKGDTILDSPEKVKKALAFMWDRYQDWGNKSEAANRMALYNQLKEKGYSHLQASFYARDMLDFSMQGAWPTFRFLTQVVPFLNARVQGLYKLGRDGIIPTSRVFYNVVTGNQEKITENDKIRAEKFSYIMAAVALASLSLYLAFKDDDEFKKREQWDRDNFWWIKLPGMDAAFRIPKPFELGAFGTMAERVAEQIIDQGAEGKVFRDSLARMLFDTFAINPMPQAFKPLVDLYSNKDSFTGAPIETAGMERLSKAERLAEKTSPLAIALSEVSNVFLPTSAELSPVQADYTIKSYFGWLGSTASWLSNYAVMPFKKSAYPDNNWTETMSAGFIKTLPATQSKYVTAFYENNKEISQAYADMRHFAQLGQADKVQEILKEKGDKIAMAKFYDNASKDMAKVRQAIQAIRNDEQMSGAQKKEEIDRLKVLIGEIARQMEEARLMVKKSYAAQ